LPKNPSKGRRVSLNFLFQMAQKVRLSNGKTIDLNVVELSDELDGIFVYFVDLA
jgi:hypothetical protein